MSRRTDPTLFLQVVDLEGIALETPCFAALNVTRGVMTDLCRLARLSEAHGIAWLATRRFDSPVYWHVSEEAMTEQTSTVHMAGTSVYIELSARRRVTGGYGQMEVIGQTPVFDLAELIHMRKQRIALDFREHGGQSEGDEPFAWEVVRRLRSVGIWPSDPCGEQA